MNRTLALAALCISLLTSPSLARAQVAELDLIENVFGATNIQAIAGAGGLTIGVSRDGDLSVLTWPSPSYTDQLSYVTSNAEDARDLPRFGASAGMGAFAGLVYRTGEGEPLQVTWLRDDGWTTALHYADQRSSVIRTYYTSAALGLIVTQLDFVLEDNDVWVRRLDVNREVDSPVTEAWALFYANLTPTLSRVPEVPLADWGAESRNDFAAVADSEGVIYHFHPNDTGVIQNVGDMIIQGRKDYGPISPLLVGPADPDDGDVDTIVASLDDDFAEGVYLTLGTIPAPDGVQVGFDETELCQQLADLAANIMTLEERYPGFNTGGMDVFADVSRCTGDVHPSITIREREGWQVTAEDALADAADGELSGSRLAAGHVNEALRVPLTFDDDGDAAATLFLGAGANAAEARTALDAARAVDSAELAATTAAAHQAWIADLRLPAAENFSETVIDFAARTLLNIRVGTDRNTGAIVASISRQPSYGQDWPRDGAFFNTALDIAGLTDLVSERNRWYASLQRTEEVAPTDLIDTPGPGYPDDPDNLNYPADAWEMNYYADGLVGGNTRFEIDNAALLIWSFVAHAGFIEDDAARLEYLEELYPNIQRGAELLVFWRDATNYLPWLANEDDNYEFTQGLQGAGTSFGALRVAAMAARELGNDEDAERWEQRAGELRWAIENVLYSPDLGFIETVTDNPGSAGTGSSSWLAWPDRVFGADDERLLAQLESNLDAVIASFDPEAAGGAYLTKTTLAVLLIHPDEEVRLRAIDVALDMINRVADPDTLYLGEVFAAIDDDGDGLRDRYSNRVSTPHLWAATLVYLSLIAAEDRDAFDPHEELLTPAELPEEIEPPEGWTDGGVDAGPDGGDAGADADVGGDASPDERTVFELRGGSCSFTPTPANSVSTWRRLLAL